MQLIDLMIQRNKGMYFYYQLKQGDQVLILHPLIQLLFLIQIEILKMIFKQLQELIVLDNIMKFQFIDQLHLKHMKPKCLNVPLKNKDLNKQFLWEAAFKQYLRRKVKKQNKVLMKIQRKFQNKRLKCFCEKEFLGFLMMIKTKKSLQHLLKKILNKFQKKIQELHSIH